MNIPRPTKFATSFTRTRHVLNDESSSKASNCQSKKNSFEGGSSSFSSVESSNLEHLSSRLNQMPREMRSDGLEDIHGVSDKKIIEDPEMIQTKTLEMTESLYMIANQGTQESFAFQKAMLKSPEYVEKLKIRFLRADAFNSSAAATRMIRFFDQKMKYFGEEKLVEEITFQDLGKEEVEVLEKGFFHLLHQRDRAGRAVIFAYTKSSVDYPTEVLMRVTFYFLVSALMDEETQKSGVVLIYYGVGQTRSVKGRINYTYNLLQGIPFRVVSFHMCRDSMVLSSLHHFFVRMLESRFLCRYRFHSGSHTECIYQLMTFGIPRDAIPVSEDGTMDLTQYHKMLEAFKYRENKINKISQPCSPQPNASVVPESFDNSTITDGEIGNNKQAQNIILVPSPMDIFLGKGRRQEKYPGMIRLHSIIEDYWDAFNAASKFDKTVIIQVVSRKLKESGCRLLESVPGGYVECDESILHDRISHKFRTIRARKRAGVATSMGGTKRNLSM